MNIQDMRVKVASTNIASLNLVDQKGVNFDYKRLLKDISAHNLDYNLNWILRDINLIFLKA